MDLLKTIKELHQEKEALEEAIQVLTHLARNTKGKRPRGRPPAFLANIRTQSRVIRRRRRTKKEMVAE